MAVLQEWLALATNGIIGTKSRCSMDYAGPILSGYKIARYYPKRILRIFIGQGVRQQLFIGNSYQVDPFTGGKYLERNIFIAFL